MFLGFRWAGELISRAEVKRELLVPIQKWLNMCRDYVGFGYM
jgi:hypothetical protein